MTADQQPKLSERTTGTLTIWDGTAGEWTRKVSLSGDPMESDEAYAECDGIAMEVANVSWEFEADDE